MSDQAPPSAGPAVVAVNYSRDVGWAGSVVLEVQRDGASTLATTFNDDGTPEIGLWRATVPSKKLDALVGSLRASGYRELPADATIPPGTKMVSLGERVAGAALPVMRGFPSPPPAALAPVLAAIDALRADLRAHPVRVVRGDVTLSTARVTRGGELVATVGLMNVGSAPLTIGNPLAPAATGWNGVRLAFAAEGRSASEQQRDLGSGDVRADAGVPRTPTVALAPGQSLRFEIHAALDLPAESYAVRVEYHGMAPGEGDPQLVGGVLWLPAGTLTIERKPWWRFW
jgi:hypothetical protein